MKKKRKRKSTITKRVFISLALLVFILGAVTLHYYYGRGTVVAIDPGHGGDDLGAVGKANEVDINETTARYLQKLLKKDSNYTPVLTRDYGDSATLNQRNSRTKWALADIFISIHSNSSASGSGHGFECYAATPDNANNKDSLAFANLVITEISKTGTTVRGENGVRYLYYDSDGAKLIKESSDDTVYDYGTLAVLTGKGIPAILVEQCFVTNSKDIDLLGDEDGCERAAIAYYHAICSYFGTDPIV